MAVGDLLKPERYNELKAKVKAEMTRRDGTGSVSAYAGTSYDYTVAPAAGGTILEEHYEKLIVPLRAVNTTDVPEAEAKDKVITEADMAQMEAKIAVLEAASMTTSNHGCSASCTGLCSTSCDSGCSTTCSGSCSGSCSGGCTGCGADSCSGTCYEKCANSCYGTCEGKCKDLCTTECANSCLLGQGDGPCGPQGDCGDDAAMNA